MERTFAAIRALSLPKGNVSSFWIQTIRSPLSAFNNGLRRCKLTTRLGTSVFLFPAWSSTSSRSDTTLLWNADNEEDDLDRFLSLDIPWQTMCPIWRRRARGAVDRGTRGSAVLKDWEYHLRAICMRLAYRKFPNSDCFYRLPTSKNSSIASRFNSPDYLRTQESLLVPVREMLIASSWHV